MQTDAIQIDKRSQQDVLTFIDSYWQRIIHSPKDSHKDPNIIPLKYTYISPNDTSHWKASMFYWDTFFMFRGLVDTNREVLLPEIVDNFVYMFKKFGIIPNASVWAFLGHSQPPFFTSMLFDSYFAIRRGKGLKGVIKKAYAKIWLKSRIEWAKKEYWQVWEDTENYHHKVEAYGLSRYGDRDVGYALTSERESGWDFTTRFYNRCNDFLPVDLNAFLHKYEKDFARAASILRDKSTESFWLERAQKRNTEMHTYMWNKKEGFFFDYDYVNKIQSTFYSLAGFTPMWANMVNIAEAKRMRDSLVLFETDYGLTITAKNSLPQAADLSDVPQAFRYSLQDMMTPKQWDYPHIWPPLEYLTVIGLLRYGFVADALRIMKKSIHAHIQVFQKYGALLEKLDAETMDKPKKFWYPTQLGFGWTNAIFYRYITLVELIENSNGNIYGNQPSLKEPPYNLSDIVH